MTLEATRRLLEPYRFCAIGKRITDFIAMAKFVPLELLAVTDLSQDCYELLQDTKIISPATYNHNGKAWNNLSLGRMVDVIGQNVLNLASESNETLNILAYSASVQWQALARHSKGKVSCLAANARVMRSIDNKIRTRKQLKRLGINVPKSIITYREKANYHKLSIELGQSMIIQEPFGTSGKGTYRINSEEDLKIVKSISSTSRLLVSSYEGPTCLNVHGLVTRKGIYVSIPSLQIIGVPELTSGWSSYCGNDFGAIKEFSNKLIKEVNLTAQRIGIWLANEKYLGIYGVDIVVSDDKICVLEINPRVQGSTWLLSELELDNHIIPFVTHHFIEALARSSRFREKELYTLYNRSIPECSHVEANGAFAMIRNTHNYPVIIRHKMKGGIYVLEDGILRWVRNAFGFNGLGTNELLIYSLASTGSCIEPGSVIVRFACRKYLAQNDGRSMTEFGRRVVNVLKQTIEIYQYGISNNH